MMFQNASRLFLSASVPAAVKSQILAGLMASLLSVFVSTSASAQYCDFYDPSLAFVPGAFDLGTWYRPNGEGVSSYMLPNGTVSSTYMGPYRLQTFTDFSNAPMVVGPMTRGYIRPQSAYWQSLPGNQYRTPYRSPGSYTSQGNQRPLSPRIENRNRISRAEEKKRDLDQAALQRAAMDPSTREKPAPIPYVAGDGATHPAWLVSAFDLIDRFVKASELGEAQDACVMLMEARSGLPPEVYVRAIAVEVLRSAVAKENGVTVERSLHPLDTIAYYLKSANESDRAVTWRLLPGGTLEKYLPQDLQRRYMEAIVQFKRQAAAEALNDDQMKTLQVLLKL